MVLLEVIVVVKVVFDLLDFLAPLSWLDKPILDNLIMISWLGIQEPLSFL